MPALLLEGALRSSLGTRPQGACQFRVAIDVEVIDPLPPLEPFRHLTLLKSKRDNEDSSLRLRIRYVQRILDLVLDVAGLGNRLARKADDHYVRTAHCTRDLQWPLLAGQQILLIKPGLKTVLPKPTVKGANDRFVLGRVTQKDPEPS